MRWDKADLNSFYSHTYDHLSAVLDHINELSPAYECNAWSDRDCCDYIDTVYNEIVYTLNNSAEAYGPEHRNFFFFKFWWDEELRSLKAASVDTNKLWKAAGKPRHGP